MTTVNIPAFNGEPHQWNEASRRWEPITRDSMMDSDRNNATWRHATVNLTPSQRDIICCVMVGAMMVLVSPEQFEKALKRAMVYLHGPAVPQ